MPKYYYDTLQKQAIELDDPNAIAEADTDPSAIPLLSKADTPFDRPVQFRIKDSGELLSVQSKAAYDEALKDRSVDLVTIPTPSEAEEQRRKERAEVEIKARREASSFGEQIADSTLATLQGFAGTMLPGIFPTLREFYGETPEQQEAFRREYSISSALGSLGGIAGQIATTAGTGLVARTAGAGAAEAAATAGGGRIAQGLAAARAAATAAPLTATAQAGEFVAAPLALGVRLGEAARAGLTAAAPEVFAAEVAAATPGASRIAQAAKLAEATLGRGTTGAVSAAISAIPAAAAYEFDESRLQNRKMSSEAVLHNALLSGAIGTLEGAVPLLKGVATSETAQKWASSLGKSQAMRLINKFDRGFFRKASKQIGEEGVVRRVNSAIDQGYLGLGKSAGKSADDIQRGLEETGRVIGELADEAVVRNAVKQDTIPLLERLSDEVVAPLTGPGSNVNLARSDSASYLARQLDKIREAYPDGMDAKDLARVRTEISEAIYGLNDLKDPMRSPNVEGLRKMRNIMTDELVKMFESAGIDKRIWKRAQDQYGVLSTAEDLVERGLLNEATKAGITDRSAAIAAGIASYKGLKPLLAGAAGVLAKRQGNLAFDYMQGAIRRAIESGAPKQTIDALERLSEQQAADAAERLSGISVAPDNDARVEFWRLSNLIHDTTRNSELSPEAAEAARSAFTKLRSFSRSGPSNLAGINRSTPGDLAADLEKANEALSSAARVSAKRKPSETDVAILRTLRDEINGSLADAGLWGPERAEKAREYYQNIIATRIDPTRVAALEGLDEATMSLRRKTASKIDKLMGGTAFRAATLAPVESEAFHSERRRFKERVFKRHEEENK